MSRKLTKSQPYLKFGRQIKNLIKNLPITGKDNWRVFKVDVIDSDSDLERRYLRLLTQPNIEKIC